MKIYDIKWWSHGPWLIQHDPDLRSDGKISVYDNNPDRGSSQILTIDPSTREVFNDLSDMTFPSIRNSEGNTNTCQTAT